MKKLLLLAIPALLLSGCNKTKVDTSNLSIICPTGAPAFAFYNEVSNPNFETNDVPKNIVAMMTEASPKDYVVIDTTSGIQAINKGAPYKLAASLTFGNFFIASTGKDDNSTMDAGDKIVLFNQGSTPDLLFHYLYGNTFDSGIEYVTNVKEAATCLISGKNAVTGSTIKYVFVAQPVLYNALQKNTSASKYVDIQEAYQEKSGGKQLIQASLFIKDSADKSTAKAYLKKLQGDIDALIKDPEILNQSLENKTEEEMTALFGVNPKIAINVLKDNNGLGLGYKNGLENKANIDAFLKEVQGVNETSQDIYYK